MLSLKEFISVSPKSSLSIICDYFRVDNGIITLKNYKILEAFIQNFTNKMRDDFDVALTAGKMKAIDRQNLEKNIFSVRKLAKKMEGDLRAVADFNVMKPLEAMPTNVWKAEVATAKAKKDKRDKKKLSFT